LAGLANTARALSGPAIAGYAAEYLGPWLVTPLATTVCRTSPTCGAMGRPRPLEAVLLLIFCLGSLSAQTAARLWRRRREVWNTYDLLAPPRPPWSHVAARLDGPPRAHRAAAGGWDFRRPMPDGRPVGPHGEVGDRSSAASSWPRSLDQRTKTPEVRVRAVCDAGWRRSYRSGDWCGLERERPGLLRRADAQVKVGGPALGLGEVDARSFTCRGSRRAAAVRRTLPHSGSGGATRQRDPKFDIAAARIRCPSVCLRRWWCHAWSG